MKKYVFIITMFLGVSFLYAQDNITDSVDVLHYDLRLDIGNHTYKRIEGYAKITARVLQPIDSLVLELSDGDIDSVWVDGYAVPHTFRNQILRMPYSGNVGDTAIITVFYRKGQCVMPSEWGGFYFDDNIYYNLGIAIYSYPHSVGKTWFPCRDNFYDKATYHFEITVKPGWKAICSGMPDSTMSHNDGSATYCWTLHQPAPTYLVGVAVAPFHVIERQYSGFYQDYPAILGFLQHDSIDVWNAFDHMSQVIPFYERCFGTYRWERVGYVSTPKGSMEHCSNISFTTSCMASSQEACLATMSHEFAHAWFGNLVTCSSSQNMWINEGGASFAEELAIQAICPEGDSMRYVGYADDNLSSVLNTAHISDGGFLPVYGVDSAHTYGNTVYRKGATVWHSLRGYIGDSLFYASLRTLFERCAFKNIDSYQLRDSLSLYSGIDLTEFFNFHVFGPGFVDYIVDNFQSDDNGETTVTIRQKSYGTDNYMLDNRLWISFFSENGERADRYVQYYGSYYEQAHFSLPFKAVFAIANFDKQLSLASIYTILKIDHNGTYEADNSFFACNATKISDTNTALLYVTHHWTRPDSSSQRRYARLADHYWEVQGTIPSSVKIQGRFFFDRSSSGCLDDDLFGSADEFPLVKLLYRKGYGDEWQYMSGLSTGGSSNGYFVVNNLKEGQYTLCLIDTNFEVGIMPVDNTKSTMTVYPNPSHGTLTIATDTPGEPLLVTVVDQSGKTLYRDLRAISGMQLDCSLPKGVFVFSIKAVDSGFTESLKVQIK